MRIIRKMMLPVVTVALFLSTPALADRRAYGETYEAVTAPQGELDVEVWESWASAGEVSSGPDARGARTMVELEYGISDRWDVALYNMVDVTRGDAASYGASYAGFKVESRVRLSQPGEWVVDPVLYFEYQRLFGSDATDTLEVKAIVARDFGPWNVALNVSLEVEHLVGRFNPEFEYAVGVSRELGSPAFKLGVEAFGKLERPEDTLESFLWAGPAVSWATSFDGKLHGLWVTVAGGHGITAESQAWYARGIVGLQF
jgi:hypothetical protein